MLVKSNEAGAIAIGTSLKNMVWHPLAFHWETVVRLEPKQTHTFAVAVAVGKDPQSECARMLEDSATVIREAREAYSRKITHLFAQLPVLEASDQRLQALYNRSLVHFLLNQWEVPEFKLHPYFFDGSDKRRLCLLLPVGLRRRLGDLQPVRSRSGQGAPQGFSQY